MASIGRRTFILAIVLFVLALISPTPGVAQEPRVWNPENGLILRGTIITQDARHTVIENGSVCIMDERIEAVLRAGERPPAGFENAQVIDTQGVILPGLINAHNHIAYNYLQLWPAPRQYGNRYEWTSPRSYREEINYPKKIVTEPAFYDMRIEGVKYAEIRELVGGTTSVQGAPPAASGFDEMLVRNIDFGLDVDNIYQHGLAITDGRFMAEVEEGGGILATMNEHRAAAWLIHLAEGVDEASRHEFQILKDLHLLREETVVIHGTALQEPDFREMAQAGTDLVWSPLSNRLLYGRTTDVITARRVGVNVSLASDWSPSGSKNLLGELKIADEIDNNEWGNQLSYQDLVDMVTINPARALHWDDRLGRIQAGYYADILVVDGRGDPYGSVVAATDRNVKLVLVGGDPLYGDDEFMTVLKGEDCEEIYNQGGRRKLIDVTKPGDERSEQPLSEIVGNLERALRFDPADMRRSFRDTRNMSAAEFRTWLDENFPNLHPVRLDPIFAEGDRYFFDTIHNSANAHFPYDLAGYWNRADRPLGGGGSTPGPTPGAVAHGTIGGALARGSSARLYETPRGHALPTLLPAGTPVEIVGHRRINRWSGYYSVRATLSGRRVEGWVYERFVAPDERDRGLIDSLRDVR